MTIRTALGTRPLILLAILIASAGCTSSHAATPPVPQPTAWAAYQLEIQQHIASCMHQAGFSYQAYEPSDTDDPQVLRIQRQRDGFLIFAPYARPDDPLTHVLATRPEAHDLTDPANPNTATIVHLPTTTAYLNALYGTSGSSGGCQAVATKASPNREPDVAQYQRIQDSFHERISAASDSYAACLRRKGYQVPAGRNAVPRVVYLQEKQRLDQLTAGGARLTPATARDELAREIAASLDDLTCGQTWFQLRDDEINTTKAADRIVSRSPSS